MTDDEFNILLFRVGLYHSEVLNYGRDSAEAKRAKESVGHLLRSWFDSGQFGAPRKIDHTTTEGRP